MLNSILDVSSTQTMRAMKPAADPACQLPEFNDYNAAPAEDLPNVKEVTEALRAYVVDRENPTPLLKSLFPTIENIDFRYDPGQGVKRPSIALTLFPLNTDIRRMSVPQMAEELCERAQKLSRLNVGPKATSKRARTFHVEVSCRYSSMHQTYELRANTPMEAAMAFRVVFEAYVDSVWVPLDVTREEVLTSAKVAYKLMGEHAAGNSSMRVKAQNLVRACDEASMMAALCFRQSTGLSPYEQSWITLDLDDGSIVFEKERECASRHERLQLETHIHDLRVALHKLWQDHDVLRSFPTGWALELQGQGAQKIASLKHNKASGHSIALGVSCSLLDLGKVEALSKHLETVFSQDADKSTEHYWILEIDGDLRSSHAFSLNGETLSEAIATHFIEKGERMSMYIQEFILDLICDRSGETPTIKIRKMVDA